MNKNMDKEINRLMLELVTGDMQSVIDPFQNRLQARLFTKK